jgi:hypothetical protein
LRAGLCLVGHGMCPHLRRCTSAAAWLCRSSLEPVTLPTRRHSQEDKEEGREGISLFSLSLVPAVPALSPPCPRSLWTPSDRLEPNSHAGYRPIGSGCPRCPRRFSCFRTRFRFRPIDRCAGRVAPPQLGRPAECPALGAWLLVLAHAAASPARRRFPATATRGTGNGYARRGRGGAMQAQTPGMAWPSANRTCGSGSARPALGSRGSGWPGCLTSHFPLGYILSRKCAQGRPLATPPPRTVDCPRLPPRSPEVDGPAPFSPTSWQGHADACPSLCPSRTALTYRSSNYAGYSRFSTSCIEVGQRPQADGLARYRNVGHETKPVCRGQAAGSGASKVAFHLPWALSACRGPPTMPSRKRRAAPSFLDPRGADSACRVLGPSMKQQAAASVPGAGHVV